MFASLIRFAAYTGIRPGELFALQHDDLDGDLIHVRRAADSKTNGHPSEAAARTRITALTDAAAAGDVTPLADRRAAPAT